MYLMRFVLFCFGESLIAQAGLKFPISLPLSAEITGVSHYTHLKL